MSTSLSRYLACRQLRSCRFAQFLANPFATHMHRRHAVRSASSSASTTAAQSSALPAAIVGKKRHRWTAEEDRLLLQLIELHGRSWTLIAGKMGIKGDPLKTRRRWEVLQPKARGFWTKDEDADLANVVKKFVDLGHTLSEKRIWVKVAHELKTDRSPRQCHTRWKTALLPRQGKALPFTRFENVHAWTWSNEETKRLKMAIVVAGQLLDPTADVERARKTEPWLLIGDDATKTLRPRFWNNIASFVGTRTASQCRCKWASMITADKKTGKPVTTEEAQRLARLVKQHGRRWIYLHKHHFPTRSSAQLVHVYSKWEQLEKKHNVDLLDLDPFSIIRDFDGKSALRPTGPDGNYDPKGPLVRIFRKGSTSFMTPYLLVFSNNRRRKESFRIWRALNPTGNLSSGSLSVKFMDKLIAAIGRYGTDWMRVSKEVGSSIDICRRYAIGLSNTMGSIKNAITDPDMESLAQKRGWKGAKFKDQQ
ncbi:hypothetical protein GGF40_004262 [Coemansia sp. RSA 1286]|nr:hypothetical protein GGF40_004262 [Coemansia sp. RSA 1286]